MLDNVTRGVSNNEVFFYTFFALFFIYKPNTITNAMRDMNE